MPKECRVVQTLEAKPCLTSSVVQLERECRISLRTLQTPLTLSLRSQPGPLSSRSDAFLPANSSGFGLHGFPCGRPHAARTTEGTCHVCHSQCGLPANRTPLLSLQGGACHWGKASRAETTAHSLLHFQSQTPYPSTFPLGKLRSSPLCVTVLRNLLQEVPIGIHFLPRSGHVHSRFLPYTIPQTHSSQVRIFQTLQGSGVPAE